MGKDGVLKNKRLESAIQDVLKSHAQSRIYLYLLRKKGAKTEDVIKGTRLHPSTVRETLSKMYSQHLIFRKKLKNYAIGKNPYIYYALPPLELIKRYAIDLESKLNRIASITNDKDSTNSSYKPVKINIVCQGDRK